LDTITLLSNFEPNQTWHVTVVDDF